MARTKQTVADYIERRDAGMRVILGELVEYVGKINLWWTFANGQARESPRAALTHLIDAEIYLDNHVRVELADSLRVIRTAISRLSDELPDDTEDPPDLAAASGDIGGH